MYEVPARPIRQLMEVQQTILELDDNLVISLSGITEKEETFFSIVKKDQRTRTGGYKTRV